MAVKRVDEVLDKALASDTAVVPRYDVVLPNGTKVAENAELVLKNPVLTAGMPINKETMSECLAASGIATGSADALILNQPGFALSDGAYIRFWSVKGAVPGATINVNSTGSKPLIRHAYGHLIGISQRMWVTAVYSAVLDSFIVQGEEGLPIGSIELTALSTLGDDWLLCNGAMVDETTYPVLAKMLPAKDITDLWDTATTAPSHYSLGTDGTIFAKVDHATCTIYYTDDPLGIWQSYVATEIAAVGTFTDDTKVHIEYMNGQWVIWGVMSVGTRIFYADKITGPYVQSTLAISTNYTMYDLMYGGGYYLVSYSIASTPLKYATALGGEWAASSALTRYSTGGIYVNGMYVYYYGTNLYYSNSPAGTYTAVSLSDVLSSNITSLQYVNGLFVVGSKARLVYASGLTGSWATVSFTTVSTTYLVYDVTYVNEHWVVCLGTGSTTGSNIGRVLVSETSDISSSYTEVSSIGGDQLACTSKICLTNTNACRGLGPQLPSVSIDGCYAFIRAKV